MFKNFIISCDEATAICDKNQYNEATFLEKLKLNWHIFICKICARYVKQNRTMTSIFKMKSIDCENKSNCLSEIDKESLKAKLKNTKT